MSEAGKNLERGGFTAIGNTMLEELMRSHLSGGAMCVILAVIRHTEGFIADNGQGRRQAHDFSIGYLSKLTGRHRSKIAPIIKNLIQRQILRVAKDPTHSSPRRLSINMVSPEWVTGIRTGYSHPNGDKSIPQTGNTVVPQSGYHINKASKERKKPHPILQEAKKAAENIYDLYAAKVRSGARADAIRNIEKLLASGISGSELRASIDVYATHEMPADFKYRIQANNFFGTAERWKEYRTLQVVVEDTHGPSVTQRLLSADISEEDKRELLKDIP